MQSNSKKEEEKEVKQPTSEISASEQKIELPQEKAENIVEKKEVSSKEDQLIREQLEREINLMNLDDSLKKQAENKAKALGSLGEEEKIKHLLEIAKEKGVVFAIKTAREMNDPYILDTFHDLLVEEGYFKTFLK